MTISIRTIVMMWLVSMIIGLVITYSITEPYPTVVMPGFAKVFQADDSIFTTDDVLILCYQNTRLIDTASIPNLFENLRYVSPMPVLRTIFTTSIQSQHAIDTHSHSLYSTVQAFRARGRQWYADICQNWYKRPTESRAYHPSTVAWLSQRIHLQQPLANRVVILWKRQTFTSTINTQYTRTCLSDQTYDSLDIPLEIKGIP